MLIQGLQRFSGAVFRVPGFLEDGVLEDGVPGFLEDDGKQGAGGDGTQRIGGSARFLGKALRKTAFNATKAFNRPLYTIADLFASSSGVQS
jgi:hypothetical protein